MNFCGSCGERLDENALVCEKCGAPQKSISKQESSLYLGFKSPGTYEEDEAPQDFEAIKVQASTPPPTWSGGEGEAGAAPPGVTAEAPESLSIPDEEEDEDEEEEDTGEYSCPNCNSALIYSLARGLWFCPADGTEMPNLPSPYDDEEEEEEEEEEEAGPGTGSELGIPGQAGMPAGPLPDMHGEGGRPRKFDKPPEEVDGVTRDAAKDSIVGIQNMIENKARSGLYSMEAESLFEQMKVAFMEFNYPAVIKLGQQTRDVVSKAETTGDTDETARADDMPMGGKRQQAINALQSSKGMIIEAEKLGYDLTESKKIYKQAEPAFRAGDYEAALNFAHDVEESVNAVLGGKRLAKAPTFQPRFGAESAGAEGVAGPEKPSWFSQNRDLIMRYVIPIGGLVVLIIGASLAYISYVDNIWNPFSDGPDDWGPYNTTGVILGIVAVVVGILFAMMPLLLTKKVYVRMEPPKPMQIK
jgi:hypothetical protein